MKFSAYLDHHAVSEWRDCYVDYAHLSRLLKYIAQGKETRPARQPVPLSAPVEVVPENTVSESSTSSTEAPPTSYSSSLTLPRARTRAFSAVEVAIENRAKDSMTHVHHIDSMAHQLNLIPAEHRYPEEIAFFTAFLLEIKKVNELYLKEIGYFTEQRDTLRNQLTQLSDIANIGSNVAEFQETFTQLKEATRALYHGLNMLLNFCVVNHVALIKVLHKHDLVSLFSGGHALFEQSIVSASFCSSNRLTALLELVEADYAATFMQSAPKLDDNGNAIIDADEAEDDIPLQADAKRELLLSELHMKPSSVSRMVVFVIGLVVGMVVAILAILTALVTLDPSTTTIPQFLGVFPVFRGLMLFALQAWLWGVIILVCERHHINYQFVLDADPRTVLTHQQVFLVSAIITVVVVFTLLLYVALIVYTDVPAGIFHLLMFLTLFVAAIWPFQHLYYHTRAYLWRTLRDVSIAPFLIVTFRQAFMGDMLTSLIRSMQDFAYSLCFYTTSDFYRTDPGICSSSKTLSVFEYILAFLPFYFRFAQSLRRYRDNPGTKLHLLNALCLFATLLSIAFNMVALHQPLSSRKAWIYVWATFAIISSLANWAWDTVVHWGLFLSQSKQYPLREISLFAPWVYWTAIIVNFFLRLTWIFTISPKAFGFDFPMPFFLMGTAVLELLRRAMWAVLRLEHEHVANVEDYRVVQSVPMLFPVHSAHVVGNIRHMPSIAFSRQSIVSAASVFSSHSHEIETQKAQVVADKAQREQRVQRELGLSQEADFEYMIDSEDEQ